MPKCGIFMKNAKNCNANLGLEVESEWGGRSGKGMEMMIFGYLKVFIVGYLFLKKLRLCMEF